MRAGPEPSEPIIRTAPHVRRKYRPSLRTVLASGPAISSAPSGMRVSATTDGSVPLGPPSTSAVVLRVVNIG